jgi:hypothetical protein
MPTDIWPQNGEDYGKLESTRPFLSDPVISQLLKMTATEDLQPGAGIFHFFQEIIMVR